jgi:hypothetical protein
MGGSTSQAKFELFFMILEQIFYAVKQMVVMNFGVFKPYSLYIAAHTWPQTSRDCAYPCSNTQKYDIKLGFRNSGFIQ